MSGNILRTMGKKNELAVDEIKRRCEAAGVTVADVCRQEGVDPTVLQRWKPKDPKSIDTYRRLIRRIEKAEKKAMKG